MAVLLVALLYRFCRTRNLPALFAVKFSILGLCALGLPALVQPPAGELSVPLAEIRTFAAEGVLLCDSSLKFQDSWIIGAKAQRVDDYTPSEPAEKICFVTRKEIPVWPEALRDYATQEHLRVEDLSGKALHLIALRRNPAN